MVFVPMKVTQSAKASYHLEKRKFSKTLKKLKKDSGFYLLLLPAVILVFIFSYIPIYGILMAFQDYDIIRGVAGSNWVGLKHIMDIFTIPTFSIATWNTLWLNALSISICFPIPILFSLLLNEVGNTTFKRTIQSVSYLPHFLSWITIIAMGYTIYSINGPINDLRVYLLGDHTQRIMFMSKQGLFLTNYLTFTVWKEMGWNSVIYLAGMSSIDQELYQASQIDGANRFHQAIHITLPHLIPTVMILLILQFGTLFNSNFELVYGLQNAFVNFDVIGTVVFKSGIQQGQYSAATALGLVQGIISFLLLAIANKVSKKASGIAVW